MLPKYLVQFLKVGGQRFPVDPCNVPRRYLCFAGKRRYGQVVHKVRKRAARTNEVDLALRHRGVFPKRHLAQRFFLKWKWGCSTRLWGGGDGDATPMVG